MSVQLYNQFTKEAIKARMMQNAANLWGVKNPQALDPFVRLLVEAFSIELYRAANESQNIEGRILDKIAGLLTPNLLTMPQPAHGIMQAMPAEPVHTLNSLVHFFTTLRIASKAGGLPDENVDVNFTSVDHLKLTKANVAYIATGYQLFAIDHETGNKQPLLRTPTALPWATCYIGIEADKAVENLEGTPFYFEFGSFGTQPWVYQLLPLIALNVNARPIPVLPGLQYISVPDSATQEEQLFRDHDMMKQLTNQVKIVYQHKFLTLGDCPVVTEQEAAPAFPKALMQSFDGGVLLQKAGRQVVWMELKFPANFTYSILEDLSISINAFPVLNRSLTLSNYSYKALNNILPMRTASHEHFLSVHEVTDGHDRKFTEIPFNRSLQYGKGYFSLRQGGAERFDERTAQDMVNYLLELTRDEVAAFSSINQDFLVGTLKDLSKHLRLLHNKAGKIEANIRQVPSYLVVEPFDEEDNLEVAYWSSQSDLANNLRGGTLFQTKNSSDLLPKSILLLSNTYGGREKLQSGEKLDAYRYVLGSRDRLVTNEDIRSFCRFELGDKLKTVVFRKGLAPAHHPKQGYVRTLDVVLIPNRYEDFDEAGWTYMAQTLLAKIIASSPDGVNYRVMAEKGS